MDTMQRSDEISIALERDLVTARNQVRLHAKQAGLGLVDETKLITAASELTRNMLNYAGGGRVLIEQVFRNDSTGVKITFEDHGPGIPDINLALTDGYSSHQGLGLGLPGSRRLVDEFSIDSEVGRGTKIAVTKWKR